MNKQRKDIENENLFDREANEGYRLFPDGEDFFKRIKNPYQQKRKGKTKAGLGLIALELMLGMLLLAGTRYMMVEHAHKPIPEKVQTASTFQPLVEAPTFKPVTIAVEKKELKNSRKSTNTTKHVMLRDTNLMVQNATVNNPVNILTKVDSVKAVEPAPVFYTYVDYAARYPMRYVNDLLILDYTDTVKEKITLNPVLTGTPATFENPEKMIRRVDNSIMSVVGKNTVYVNRLNRPLQKIKREEYHEAFEMLKKVNTTNSQDQNVLFYSAICLFNVQEYTQALLFLNKLETLKECVFEQDVDWYMAQCYQHIGYNQKFETLMKKIVHSNSYYHTLALEQLNSVKN